MFVLIQPDGGGAERASSLLLAELAKSTWVAAVYLRPAYVDLPVQPFPTHSLRIHTRSPLRMLRAAYELRRLIKSSGVDILHAHCELPEFLVIWGTIGLKCEIRITQHSMQPYQGWLRPVGYLTRWFGRLRKVHWFAPAMIKRIALNRALARVLPNPVTVSVSDGSRYLADWIDPVPTFIGRMHPEKNPQLALDVAARAGYTNFIFYGKGPLQDHLNVPTDMNVQYKGFVTDPWKSLIDGSIILITSLHEADGLVIIEAIMTGTPLLVLNFPGLERKNLPRNSFCESIEEMESKLILLRRNINYANSLVDKGLSHDLSLNRAPSTLANLYLSL